MQKNDLPEWYKKEKDLDVKDQLMLFICTPWYGMSTIKLTYILGRFQSS